MTLGARASNLAIAMAAAAAAPLIVDLLPLPKVPPIVSEIVARILIGPQVLDIVRVSAPLEVFSQLGLVFLFFLAGLELRFEEMAEGQLRLVGTAFAISLGLAVAIALVFDAAELVGAPEVVAIMLAATSFGIVAAVLEDAGELSTPFGRLVIAGASIGDFATVILLSVFFSHQGSGAESTIVLLVLFAALVATVGVLLAGARGSHRLRAAVVRLQQTSARVRLAFALLVGFVVVRGLPALLYRRFVDGREAVAAGLMQATSLSFLVPATQIGVELGKIDEAAAAGLVAGGVNSVLVFPALALSLLPRGRT